MFEAPSGKNNDSVSQSKPATVLSTGFAVAMPDLEALSTRFPHPSRTTGRIRGDRLAVSPSPLPTQIVRNRTPPEFMFLVPGSSEIGFRFRSIGGERKWFRRAYGIGISWGDQAIPTAGADRC